MSHRNRMIRAVMSTPIKISFHFLMQKARSTFFAVRLYSREVSTSYWLFSSDCSTF